MDKSMTKWEWYSAEVFSPALSQVLKRQNRRKAEDSDSDGDAVGEANEVEKPKKKK